MEHSTHAWILGGVAIGLALTLACSREEPPRQETAAPAPAVAPPAAASAPAGDAERVRAELEKAASELPGTSDAPPAATTPESEEARKQVDAMLQDVRKQLEQKASELGTEPPAEPSQP